MGLSVRYAYCCLMVVALVSISAEGALLKGLGICSRADYPSLCRNVINGARNPYNALENAIHKLMSETKQAMGATRGQKSNQIMQVCRENYSDAMYNLRTCFTNIRTHDKPGLNINLSAALTDFVTCDDAISEGGVSSPVTRTNARLRQMASNCLFLSSLVRRL